jgi:hypothetical protein
MSIRDSDDFFVGYLPTPGPLRNLLRGAAASLVALAALAAGVIASRQRDPGNGVWEADSHVFSGVLINRPYPMLQRPDGTTLLLVGEGKVGIDAKEGGIRATGTIIRRGNLTLLEVQKLERAQVVTSSPPAFQQGAALTFHGEIIDPKCFAGAMKPGTGKTHKACAALCLRGGIPPAFVTDAGEVFVLTNGSGHALAGQDLDPILAHAGEVVTLTATPARVGDVRMLAIDPARPLR